MLEKSELVTVRDVQAGDHNFILATWLRGLRYGNDWFELIEADVYFTVYHKVIEAILAKPGVSVKVACLKDDPEVVLGYSVYYGEVLYWTFVKKAWRRIGIAKSLVPPTIRIVSHVTTVGRSIMKRRPGVRFNPFTVP